MFKTIEIPLWTLALGAIVALGVAAGTGAAGFALGRKTAPTPAALVANGGQPNPVLGKATEKTETAKPPKMKSFAELATEAELLGVNAKTVREKLGAPHLVDTTGLVPGQQLHDQTWTYHDPDQPGGLVLVHFRKDRVVEVARSRSGG